MTALLDCSGLAVAVNGRTLVKELQLTVEPGAFIAVLGPNGVGKTLTLHTLAGLRAPAAGAIRLTGLELDSMPRREIAKRLGLLLQIHDDAFPGTALEAAVLGRHARRGFWQWEATRDREIAFEALAAFGLEGFESRMLATLSGGERRRVALATLKVQDPDLWLLDEPMNHLDPQHQLEVLTNLEALAGDGRSVVATMHDPVLVARFCSMVLMLYGDGNWDCGPSEEMLTPERLEHLYHTPYQYLSNGERRVLLPA